MRNFFYLILLLLIIVLIGGCYWFGDNYCLGSVVAKTTTAVKAAPAAAAATAATAAAATKTAPVAAAKTLGAWKVSDGSKFNFTSNDYYNFKTSNANHLTPRSKGLDDATNKTVKYLKGNPERALTVTGYYKKEEKNSSIFPDLGLARANNVSKHLIGLGVPATQINTVSKLIPQDYWVKNGTVVKGVDWTFNKKVAGTDRIGDIKKRLAGKPITLYFGTNQSEISLNAQQRKDFADIVYYLGQVNGSKLNVAGHTDDVGNRTSNVKLSKDRATFVQNYLQKNGGISVSKMAVAGYGPDRPIDKAKTAEARKKNRRVEVTLN